MAQVKSETDYRRFGDTKLSDRVTAFKEVAEGQSSRSSSPNPYAEKWSSVTVKTTSHKNDPNYGRPIEGSLTEKRGIKAHNYINNEMRNLCDIIRQNGVETEGSYVIAFRDIFRIYTNISDKVVGLLLRARKHGMLTFEGEMLFQKRDDDVPIFLFKKPPARAES